MKKKIPTQQHNLLFLVFINLTYFLFILLTFYKNSNIYVYKSSSNSTKIIKSN